MADLRAQRLAAQIADEERQVIARPTAGRLTDRRRPRARGQSVWLLWLLGLLFHCHGCAGKTEPEPKPSSPTVEPKPAVNVFDAYLDTGFTPADGFDLPFIRLDRGWKIATRFAETGTSGINPGEDWAFAGDGAVTRRREVCAVAHGRVVFAGDGGEPWGKVLVVEHVFYENYEQRKLRALYAGYQQIRVRPGEEVRRGQPVAVIAAEPGGSSRARLHLELRWDLNLPPAFHSAAEGKDRAWVEAHYADPSAFINAHRRLPVPPQEPTLILVDQRSYKMRLYRGGKVQGEYDVSFGQARGQKRLQGDNRTPKGMYFVVSKHRGQFEGAYGAYYGGHWIKLNYPNRFDAAWGRSEGVISPQQEQQISANWERRAPTLETTHLGGGIGFHGWAREWSNDGPRHLSWGCVVLHLYDISRLYDQIPEGTMVVIF